MRDLLRTYIVFREFDGPPALFHPHSSAYDVAGPKNTELTCLAGASAETVKGRRDKMEGDWER